MLCGTGLSRRWLVDVGDRAALEEPRSDEIDEAEGRNFGSACSSDDAKQQVGDQSSEDLQADGVFRSAEKGADFQMLLDPSEQQLDLPTLSIKSGDFGSGVFEIVGEDGEDTAVVSVQL